jgi:hypothetical protein
MGRKVGLEKKRSGELKILDSTGTRTRRPARTQKQEQEHEYDIRADILAEHRSI